MHARTSYIRRAFALFATTTGNTVSNICTRCVLTCLFASVVFNRVLHRTTFNDRGKHPRRRTSTYVIFIEPLSYCLLLSLVSNRSNRFTGIWKGSRTIAKVGLNVRMNRTDCYKLNGSGRTYAGRERENRIINK